MVKGKPVYKILLAEPTRYFAARGKQLYRVGFIDGSLSIGRPLQMVYDHRDQLAVSFERGGRTFYLLVSELSEKQKKELGVVTLSTEVSPELAEWLDRGGSPDPTTRH